MHYYDICLSKDVRDLCTIILPWGKYKYKCLPIGMYKSPDIFQEKMNELFSRIEFIRAYINDQWIITRGDRYNHLYKLELVLKQITENRIKYKIKKTYFGQKMMEYLDLLVTWTGIRPINKKVENIVNMKPPKNQKQMHSLIGLVS